MNIRRSLLLSWRAQRHYWFRYWLAAAIIAAAVTAIHINLALTLRPLERTTTLIDRFQQHFLIIYDSYVTSFEAGRLDQHANTLQQAGVIARHDFLCSYFFSEADPLPLLMCSLPAPQPLFVSELFKLVQGQEAVAGNNEIIIEENLATRWYVDTGSTLQLFRNSRPVRVAGIYTRNNQVAFGDVFAPLPLVQQLKNRPGELSFSLLEISHRMNIENARQAIAASLPELQVLPAARVSQRLHAGSRPLRIASYSQSMLIAVLCGLIGLFTLFSLVNERMRDFQLLRSLGISRLSLFMQILMEGLLVGVKGAISGVIIGEFILVSIVPGLHPVLGGHSQWQELLLPAGIGILVGLLGAMLPAIKACRAQAHELLRS